MVHENIFTEALRKRRSLDLNSYNTLIVADPGEGGNFVIKTDVVDVLQNTNNDVIVIDAFGEYGPELDAFEAKRIKLSPGGVSIDPLYRSELISFDDTEDMSRAADLLLAMMKSMELCPSPLHMSSANKAICSAIKRAYEPGNKNISSVLAELAKEEDSQTKLFVNWMNQFDFFSNTSPMDLTSRCTIVCLDSFDQEHKAAVEMMILTHLLPVIYEKFRNTGKFTWVYIPHLDALLEKDSDRFILSFVKRLRKYAGICVGSVEKGSFGTRTSQAVYNLCSCIYVMNPSKKAHEWLDALDIAPEAVGPMDNIAYALGGETGFIPPHDMKEDIPEIVPEEGTVSLSSGQNLNFLERAVYNILFKHRKRAD